MLGIRDGLGDGIWLGAGVKANIFVNSSPPAGFVASFRPSRGGLRFAIWRQVEHMTGLVPPNAKRREQQTRQKRASHTIPFPVRGRERGVRRTGPRAASSHLTCAGAGFTTARESHALRATTALRSSRSGARRRRRRRRLSSRRRPWPWPDPRRAERCRRVAAARGRTGRC